MAYYFKDDVDREKSKLKEWYEDLVQALDYKEVETGDVLLYFEPKIVEINDVSIDGKMSSFSRVKKKFSKLKCFDKLPKPKEHKIN